MNAVCIDRPDAKLNMIDEIGKMECLSRKFKEIVKRLLDSDRMMFATSAQHGGGLIAEIKSRRNVRIYTRTPYNRDGMRGIISTQAANQYPKRPNTYSPNSNIPSNHCMDASSAILRRRATAGEKTLKSAVARAQASPRES